MFYRDRLDDDYETHQRNYNYLKDELDVLVADAKVKKQSWYKGVLSHLGDGLIAVGNSIKKQDGNEEPATPSPRIRRRNETFSQ